MLIFRQWSKYIKSAKFCAEFDGAIGYFWKQLNHAAIQFLLIWCCRCWIEYRRYRRIDGKKLAPPSHQWHVLHFLYRMSRKKSQSTQKRSVWYLSPTSGSFLTKKAELSFGEGDSQRRNLLKLSIKKYKKMLDSLYVEKYEKMWDRVVRTAFRNL